MAINSKDLFAKLPEARRKKILARAEEMIAEEMNLAQLREALERSQAELAEKCGVQQAAISRLERRTDMRVSTLRNLVEAMGGNLQILVEFRGHGPIRISQFDTVTGVIEIDPLNRIAPGQPIPIPESRFTGRGPLRRKRMHARPKRRKR